MMSIEQAIIHAEEVAELNDNTAYNLEPDNWMVIAQCEKCAAEHRQLAAWLRELQERRKEPEIVQCGECEKYDGMGYCSKHGIWICNDDFCSRAERRTE